MTIKDLKPGQSAVVTQVGGEGALRQHLLDMGLIPGVSVTLVKYAPMGDPLELRVNGYELTLRLAEADQVTCTEVAAEDTPEQRQAQEDHETAKRIRLLREVAHPGLGEGGRFHDRKTEHPLPEGTTLTFALAGNQNSGKTTLFNQLTGSRQRVGNFPGVTVDRKSGAIRGHANTEVTDLPGIYSMSPYTSEEVVSRQFILDSKPTGIIDIVDATNIERNLYLTLQLIDLDVPMVVALNMMDEMQGNGGSVLVNEMEEELGVPVVPISASEGEGIDELVEHALHVARYQERPQPRDFCTENDRGGAVHRAIHGVMSLVGDHAKAAGIPVRFAATKLLEGDSLVLEALKLDDNEREMLGHITRQMETESGLDHAAAIAEMRFSFIRHVVDDTVIKPHESRERERSRAIDRVLTGKYTAIPAFVGIMALIFWLTFDVIGARLQDLLAQGIDWLGGVTDAAMASAGINPAVRSLVTDGVFGGVGTVVSFLPIIVVLFFFLSLLEDTGYMARIAFVMDKLLRKIGLSGRSMVPMLLGFGCSVPAVMSSRTLPSERDRKLTVTLIPFMSCSAKLPIYAFLTAAFFPDNAALVMVLLYFTGIVVGILVALVSKKTTFKGEAVPFVMELPNYRLPSAKTVGLLLWEKSKDFITRAFSVIFVATLVIWFLQHFDLRLQYVTDASTSLLADVAGWTAPLFAPLGLGDWRICTALIAGFMAKESVVSTLNVLFGSMAALHAALTPATALVLLVFCLLYTPCVAAIASIRRELGSRWAAGTALFQCAIAWVVAFAVRLVELAVL